MKNISGSIKKLNTEEISKFASFPTDLRRRSNLWCAIFPPLVMRGELPVATDARRAPPPSLLVSLPKGQGWLMLSQLDSLNQS